MGLRPGRCYRKFERPYTRRSIRVPKKGYVKGVPASKITQFEAGTKGNYDSIICMNSKRSVQIRHNSLESARIVMVQIMEKPVGTAARVRAGQCIAEIHVLKQNIQIAKLAFKKASYKLPTPVKLEIGTL